jgi:RNA polymerase sigma-70 factor (ECF subfamily)
MKKNNYESQTEKQLLSRCRRGDMNAFEEIIFRNKKYIYSWILSKEKNQHRAEDIFQRTLIKSWKAIKKFKGDRSLSFLLLKENTP